MTLDELIAQLVRGSISDHLGDNKVLVHIKASDINIEEFFEIEDIEMAQDGTGNIHLIVEEQELDENIFNGKTYGELRTEFIKDYNSDPIVPFSQETLNAFPRLMPEEKNPLQLKLTPPEGYEYCWIEQMKLCPRGSVVGDKLEPIGPFQLPGTHWKSVSDNRHPELSQYWAFSTMTPNPNVRAIEHYLYKDLILCERPIEHRKAEQDEYNEQLRSFKELSFGKEGASLFSRAEIETLQDHPLLSDPDGKKAKHLEPLLANVDNTLLPLMQNINLMCSDYDAELKRQRILTREDERRIAEETAKRLFDMLKRD